jgi:hypothetical protein
MSFVFAIFQVMSKKFTRTIEDFSCENCGKGIVGNGYTNHCPACLWSKHVDVNPGDREAGCGGMMAPVAGYKEGQRFMISHRCLRCAFERRATLLPEDNFDAFIALSGEGL